MLCTQKLCRNVTSCSGITCNHAGLKWSKGLTPQQFGLAVDEVWFPCRTVALAGVVEDLDEGALLSSWTGAPLIKRIFKHQVELRAVLKESASEECNSNAPIYPEISALHKQNKNDQKGGCGSLLCWGRCRWPAAADQVSTVTFWQRK